MPADLRTLRELTQDENSKLTTQHTKDTKVGKNISVSFRREWAWKETAPVRHTGEGRYPGGGGRLKPMDSRFRGNDELGACGTNHQSSSSGGERKLMKSLRGALYRSEPFGYAAPLRLGGKFRLLMIRKICAGGQSGRAQ
ncbi:MAG TPA: hypothetical protein VIB79_21345 [Candidatus Binatia bacterium]|jgi:hypothetical protein